MEAGRTDKFYKKLVGAAQEMFDQIAHLVPHDQFSPKDPRKLSAAPRKEFVDFLLSPDGLKLAEREDGSQVINYAAEICKVAGIPHYDETIPYMLKGHNHRVFGFSETGAKLTKQENAELKKGLKDLWCLVNSCIYDLHAPTHSEHGVPLRENVNFGDKNSPPEFKAIEKSIDMLRANKKGDYTVTVPYATNDENSGSPSKIKFNAKHKITLHVKTANDASELAIFWNRLGQKVDIAHVNERG